MTEMYKYNGRVIFNIDSNGDNFESFKTAVGWVREQNADIKDTYLGGWDTSFIKFKLCGIEVEIWFRDFGGTELSVQDSFNLDLDIIFGWVQSIKSKL